MDQDVWKDEHTVHMSVKDKLVKVVSIIIDYNLSTGGVKNKLTWWTWEKHLDVVEWIAGEECGGEVHISTIQHQRIPYT